MLRTDKTYFATKPDISGQVTISTYNSIIDIDKEFWDDLVRDVFNSWDFLYCLEKSQIENSRMKYLIFYESGNPVGIAVFSLFSISLDLLSGPIVSRLCTALRKFFPGFMKVKFLFCGTPVSIGKNNLRITDTLYRREVLNLLAKEITATARVNNTNMVCLKEFLEADCKNLISLNDHNFIKACSIPYVKLKIHEDWNSFDDYLNSMRHNYRRQIKRSLKKFHEGNALQIGIKVPGESDAKMFYELYIEVMNRARNKMEILNKEFFEYTFSKMDSNFYLISLEENNSILGSAIIALHDDVMTFLLVGLDYKKNKEYDVYFNLVYRIISFAIEKKCRVLEMGQTSYDLKQRCGGYCEEMFFFIKSLNKPLNYLLLLFRKLLFPVTRLKERHVFHL